MKQLKSAAIGSWLFAVGTNHLNLTDNSPKNQPN
jgi:hypothetical protein